MFDNASGFVCRCKYYLWGAGMNTLITDHDIFSRKQAAEFLGICVTTLDRLDIPRTRIRHRVMFKREVLNKWIDEKTKRKMGGK